MNSTENRRRFGFRRKLWGRNQQKLHGIGEGRREEYFFTSCGIWKVIPTWHVSYLLDRGLLTNNEYLSFVGIRVQFHIHGLVMEVIIFPRMLTFSFSFCSVHQSSDHMLRRTHGQRLDRVWTYIGKFWTKFGFLVQSLYGQDAKKLALFVKFWQGDTVSGRPCITFNQRLDIGFDVRGH